MFARKSITATALWLLPSLLQCSLAQSGSFDFLTYNVAGLPAIINSNEESGDKEANANTIGSKLATGAYDIVHMQEDFNYHAYIYETDNHPYRTATSGGVPFGSGLNTVANYDWTTFNRIKWNSCNINEGDCLTPKGFTFMRMQLAEGVELDLYNLHADAGSDTGDADARRSGIEQILAYIDANSAGRAIIVGGDTNDRYTNSDLSITLLTGAGFNDAWIELIKGGQYPTPGSTANACDVPAASTDCEIVDKVLYRSGDAITLEPVSFEYLGSEFLQDDGSNLSDHNPVHVDFTWSAA